MTQENQNKLVNAIINFMMFIVTIFIVFTIKVTTIDIVNNSRENEIPRLKQEISELKGYLELQTNYNDWYKCINNAKDSSDRFICDSLYNPNQDFIY